METTKQVLLNTKRLKNKPLRFGLYGEDDVLLPDFIHCETMEYRSRKNNWIIAPHLHSNLFQAFFIYSGNVCFIFGESRHEIGKPAIVTIPENILHGLEVGKNIKGMVLTISSSFVETLFSSTPSILSELSNLRILKELQAQTSYEEIKHFVKGLAEEMHDEFPGKGMVLQNYLHLLLNKIYRLSSDRIERALNNNSNNKNALFIRSFQKSVKQSYTPMKSIEEYAKELSITTVHLNRICQSTIGKSALQIVHDFLFMEAEKYIKHTEYSISEVAYRLNFEDPAYFSRFFRRMSGVSPKEFRTKAVGSSK